jgi:Tfp pilus assembly pilus retraction ATPase PilT
MNHLDPHKPQIMNVIQQGMQAGMVSFHSSYNEQYHQPLMQQFDSLNASWCCLE